MHASTALSDVLDPRSPAVIPRVPRPPVLKALTSVRFFAALHVALFHLIHNRASWGFLAGAMAVGYSGVSFFFVLSGFILTYSHAVEFERGMARFSRFWVARFARIYPVYFLSMIFAAISTFASFREKKHIIAFVADLLMVQSWSMRMVNFFCPGAWTLSCEAFFYLAFPFTLMFIRPKSRAAAVGWIVGFYALAMAAPLLCVWLFPGPAWVETSTAHGNPTVFLVSRLPLLAVPEFFAGMSLGWLFLRFRPSLRASAAMAYSGLLLMAIALLCGDYFPYIVMHNGVLIPLYGLILLGISQPNVVTRLISGPALVLLGEASFAFYLVHLVVIQITPFYPLEHPWWPAMWRLAVALGLSLVMHIYVERPGRKKILAWWANRHPAQLKTL